MTIRRLTRVFLYSLIILLPFILVACGLQIQRKDQGPLVKPPDIPRHIVQTEKVQVTFIAQSPTTTLDTFQLALDILDDLSGYQDNISRYPMQNKGDNHFEVSVVLDKGFDYRYRYVITDPSEAVETTLSGQAVDMRMLIAVKDLQVHDLISNWSSAERTAPNGTISGQLKDYKTQEGIPDLLVTVAGLQTFTDMSGSFSFSNVPEGTHNLVAYAVDGSYAPLQQQAMVSAEDTTRVDVRLFPLEKVKFQFQVKPPHETTGVPIRLAGNFVGIGAHYEAFFSKTGSITSLMPLLSQVEQDSYSLELELYAGSAFRYRYTMGNGYLNAERSEEAGLVTRKFIVPKFTATVKDAILTWRADDLHPITIYVDAPVQTPPDEIVSIQVFRKDWDQPIPMWHVRDQKWMYLLFSNGQNPTMDLRFCRNDNCELGFDESSHEQTLTAVFNESTEINHQVTSWHNWRPEGKIVEDRLDMGDQNALTGLEFTQVYKPIDLTYLNKTISQLKNKGVNWLIFRPGWEVYERNGLPFIRVSEKDFILYRDLAEMTKAAQNAGLKVSLFPKITFPMKPEDWWQSATRSEAFWQQWYQQYDAFLNNNALFVKKHAVDHLIIGEDGLNFSLPGGLAAQEAKMGTPETAMETWQTMLDHVHREYQVTLLWASTVTASPLDQTIQERLDGNYLMVNFSEDVRDSSQLLARLEAFLTAHDNNSEKPVYLALNFPAINSGAMEYTNLVDPIIPGKTDENESVLDLNMQSQLYRDFTCGIKGFNGISGVSSRGFYGALHLTDISSSIYGKPAMDEFLNCRNISQ